MYTQNPPGFLFRPFFLTKRLCALYWYMVGRVGGGRDDLFQQVLINRHFKLLYYPDFAAFIAALWLYLMSVAYVRLLVGWCVGLPVCHNFLNGREVTLPCSYQCTCFFFSLYLKVDYFNLIFLLFVPHLSV